MNEWVDEPYNPRLASIYTKSLSMKKSLDGLRLFTSDGQVG